MPDDNTTTLYIDLVRLMSLGAGFSEERHLFDMMASGGMNTAFFV